MSDPITNELLAELHASGDALTDAACALRDDLSTDQLVWQPPDGGWSIASCFEHLAVTAELYVDRLDDTIERSRALGMVENRPYHPTWIGGWLVKAAGPGGMKKVGAPKKFRPAKDGADPKALDRFIKANTEVLRQIRSADGCDLNRVRFGSPITWLIRLSIGDALHLLVRHGQRHVGQAHRIRDSDGFPDS
jgi:uncharacterized damage-inducible protein DinB